MQALLTSGVFSSGHFIPYIFMEWDLLAIRQKENLSAVIELLQSNGYTAWSLQPLGVLDPDCLEMGVTDVLWIHRAARGVQGDETVYIGCVTM